MARSGKKAYKKTAKPDVLYSSRTLGKLINRVMKSGKKSTAQNLVYKALERIKEKGHDPLKTFETALANVEPRMEVRPRRVGGASYQVPMEVRGERRLSLAISWIVDAATKRSNKEFHTFDAKLTAELLDAFSSQGEAVRKRDLMHKSAEANKAFAHFRW